MLTIAKVKPYKPVEKIYWCRGGIHTASVAALRCFEIAQDVPTVQQKIFATLDLSKVKSTYADLS
ncbi:hypothetical protein [Acinetobacter junii]|uniref:hypothetical protein n=1 Tax=Acinetobacter junii TaxID=40215 RepID=UPI003AF50487